MLPTEAEPCQLQVGLNRVKWTLPEPNVRLKQQLDLCFWDTFGCKQSFQVMVTSSNGNIFRVTGPLCWKFTGPRWIPLTKASDAELWCFLSSALEQTVEETIKTPVFWDAIALIMTSWLCKMIPNIKIGLDLLVSYTLVLKTSDRVSEINWAQRRHIRLLGYVTKGQLCHN